MQHAVDDDLRRVDGAITANFRIGTLAQGKAVIGQRVLPAHVIPVVDRQRQGDEIRILGPFVHHRIGGRAGGAALAREEFDHRARLGKRRPAAGQYQHCCNKSSTHGSRPK
jgi:hypothetical protein